MEKFSRKERIALVIFGMILLAIIIQMIWRLGEFSSPSGGIIVKEAEPDLSRNLLKPGDVKMTASSHNHDNQVVDKLIDNNGRSFWHIASDEVGGTAWVTVDFGEGNRKAVGSMMALPRHDLPRQSFRTAELFGSNNGEDWELVSEIRLGRAPEKAAWIKWKFVNDRAWRYYRLLITDGHEGDKFYSMAELALFE